MIKVLIIAGMGLGALYLWRKHQSSQNQASIYYGAPAWPLMAPLIVPQIGLPPGVQQAPTYYGVNAALLEPFLK